MLKFKTIDRPLTDFVPFKADWGLCCNEKSRHFTETVFEYFICPMQREEGWGAHSFSEGGIF